MGAENSYEPDRRSMAVSATRQRLDVQHGLDFSPPACRPAWETKVEWSQCGRPESKPTAADLGLI